jgi:hypothetical protein
MHTRLPLLCLSLAGCACCLGYDGTPTAPENFHSALPSHVKLVDGLARLEAKAPGKATVNLYFPATAACGTCAHILVIPAPRDLDPKMILRVPKQSTDRMPVHKGLPVCPQDLR